MTLKITDPSYISEDMLDKVVEQATIKHPDEMVDEYIDDILESVDRNLKERGLSRATVYRALSASA